MKLKRGFYDVFVRTCALNPSNIAVRQYTNGTYDIYTYSELYGVSEYISQILQQFKCNKDVIGLVTERNVIVPCVIAAAHKCCNTFMFIDPLQNIETASKIIKFKIVISIKDNTNNSYPDYISDKNPDKTISVFNYLINFYKQDVNCNLLSKGFIREHSFIATTSGSTGEKKHIQVPVQSIQPNIDDLTILFNVSSSDIIYFSTPLTFDPSMVEILLAFKNGASLLIAPENVDILFPKNHNNSITVWQTTPSKFFQYSNNDIRSYILSANSTLKILALGGEPLTGIRRLSELKHKNNKTRLFTLYGVTEMSCWACVAELDLNKTVTDREVPLGSCLSETQVHVDTENSCNNSGKIILVSNTRKCIVLKNSRADGNECSLKFIDTGDIGEVNNGTIYYRGRKDDTIKRFGTKVNLQYVENSIMECPGLKTCSCIWLPKLMFLVLYFSSETVSCQELSKYIASRLEDRYRPDKIIKVDNLPTNQHGKTSKLILSKMYEKDLLKPQDMSLTSLTVLQELQSLSNKLTIDEIKDKPFFSIGGTSFHAMTICNKLNVMYPELGGLILPHLISNNSTIQDVMQLIEKEYCSKETTGKKRSKRPGSRAKRLANNRNVKAELNDTKGHIAFEELWKYGTGKCVDASPTLYVTKKNVYVSVSSHSGKIIVVDAITGVLQGTIKLNSRIEASIYCFDNGLKGHCGVVGAYDGTIICFTLANCEEIWRINVKYMIKSKATCCDDILYVAAYDGIIRGIDVMNGKIKHTIKVAEHAISADIVIAKNGYIMVCTLSGVCASVDARTKKVPWRGKLNSPVFASPVLYDDDKYVVFAEVSGELHCLTVDKGIKVWMYQGAKGNIFSSLYIRNLESTKWQFVFGCHDNGVYSIVVNNFLPILQWRAELTSPVYATPCCLGNKLLIAVSTDGKMFLINSESGTIVTEYQFSNETFSSPAVYDNKIFIGCRNDYLYCIKYSVNL